MLKSQSFWHFCWAIPITIYFVSFVAGFIVYVPYEWMGFSLSQLGVIAFFTNLVLHILELPYALRLGHQYGLTKMHSFVRTMLFGFTWWVPLKLGVWKR